jgi:hypothetical protein
MAYMKMIKCPSSTRLGFLSSKKCKCVFSPIFVGHEPLYFALKIYMSKYQGNVQGENTHLHFSNRLFISFFHSSS